MMLVHDEVVHVPGDHDAHVLALIDWLVFRAYGGTPVMWGRLCSKPNVDCLECSTVVCDECMPVRLLEARVQRPSERR